MSISNISNSPLTPTQPGTSGPAGAPADPSASFSSLLGDGNTETDSLSVSLPNGFSVGIAHIGGGFSGFSAQMLSSLEDMVKAFSKVDIQDGAQPSKQASADPASGGGAQQSRTLDTFHADLPDGTSIEVRHGGPEGENNPTAMDAMMEAVQSLMSDLAGAATQTKGVAPSPLNQA